MRRRIIIVAVLLAVLGVAGWLIYRQLSQNRSDKLILHGNVDIRQVNAGFRVSGRLNSVNCEEGDLVRAGDVIAQLDEGPYQDQVHLAEAQIAQAQANYTKMLNGFRLEEIEQARAQLAQAKANYENALRTFEREDKLLQTHVISQSDYDAATSSRDSLKAQSHTSGPPVHRTDRLHFARGRIHTEKRGDSRAAHGSGLSFTRHFGKTRSIRPPGYAGDGAAHR